MKVLPREPHLTRQQREKQNIQRLSDALKPPWYVVAVFLVAAVFIGYVLFGLGRAYERGVIFP